MRGIVPTGIIHVLPAFVTLPAIGVIGALPAGVIMPPEEPAVESASYVITGMPNAVVPLSPTTCASSLGIERLLRVAPKCDLLLCSERRCVALGRSQSRPHRGSPRCNCELGTPRRSSPSPLSRSRDFPSFRRGSLHVPLRCIVYPLTDLIVLLSLLVWVY